MKLKIEKYDKSLLTNSRDQLVNNQSKLVDNLEDLNAQEIIKLAGNKYQENLVFLCSFQKEESVLIDIITKFAPKTQIKTIDTGVLFKETLDTWKKFEEFYNIKIERFSAYGNWTGLDNCCGKEKVKALENSLENADAWITGIRREQSPLRAKALKLELDNKRNIEKYNPLADWTNEDIWNYINKYSLPYNQLHNLNYDSIGCKTCTSPGAGREGRWAGTNKTECGIHI